tara:strand:- start:1964 stop:2509 length:546 start_codon:yes stop_codon:yes gene_type:complete
MNRDWTIRRGISMAETIISTILVGFVLVSTLQIVGPMVRSTSVHADRLVAASLAHELAEEIGTKWYTEPDLDSLDARGVDDGERAAQRTDFDDVDDYHTWTASPPKISSGQSNIFLGGWARSVDVIFVELSDVKTESKTDTGLKRVTVTVSKNGVVLATDTSLHSQSADDLGFIVTSGGGK